MEGEEMQLEIGRGSMFLLRLVKIIEGGTIQLQEISAIEIILTLLPRAEQALTLCLIITHTLILIPAVLGHTTQITTPQFQTVRLITRIQLYQNILITFL